MEYFHGTIKGGFSELKPSVSQFSNLKEPLVYLTTSRQLALHYIWDEKRIGVKMPMLDIRKNGTAQHPAQPTLLRTLNILKMSMRALSATAIKAHLFMRDTRTYLNGVLILYEDKLSDLSKEITC